ncbi:response regulator transcription factor [Robiginitalea sp. M366]|uniref:response regulator transcription factor n=1 Tax=Robiginitalea aestuariiviva TaxID=3036903 RepID=UPI00240D8AA2|nr:response regulator transcription factor [Robiginitalea aestuariiviva]MDG1572943.1 response regulator transcription factor [Robiginitalea aestuariiviva]
MTQTRLLLADDDEMLAALLKFRLEKEGFLVDWVADGRQMKESLNQALPEIIVSDIMMPYFSGIEMVDYVRNTLGANIPIIIISTAGNETNVLSAFELGADDFIAKPVNPTELIIRVRKLLRSSLV